MVFNDAFNNVSVISWLRKLEYPRKSTDLSEVTDKLHHRMLYRIHLVMNGFRTDRTYSCKSNYNMITTMTSPQLMYPDRKCLKYYTYLSPGTYFWKSEIYVTFIWYRHIDFCFISITNSKIKCLTNISEIKIIINKYHS